MRVTVHSASSISFQMLRVIDIHVPHHNAGTPPRRKHSLPLGRQDLANLHDFYLKVVVFHSPTWCTSRSVPVPCLIHGYVSAVHQCSPRLWGANWITIPIATSPGWHACVSLTPKAHHEGRVSIQSRLLLAQHLLHSRCHESNVVDRLMKPIAANWLPSSTACSAFHSSG